MTLFSIRDKPVSSVAYALDRDKVTSEIYYPVGGYAV